MDRISAEDIGRKARALKHCVKLMSKIEKTGSAEIVLNCTGVKFIVHKNDALHLKIATTKAQLEEEIGSFEIIRASQLDASLPSGEPNVTVKDRVIKRRGKVPATS